MVAVTAVTAVVSMPGMPLVTVMCVVVLIPSTPSVLSVWVSLTLVDGSVARFARAVLGSIDAVLSVLVGVFRSSGVERLRC
jgi:hypothetical protein